MERRTEIEYPDGTTKTIIEKEGFVVRDVIFSGIGALCGIGGSVVAWNYIGKIMPVATTPAKKAGRIAAQAIGSIVAEEFISDNVTKSLTDTSDLAEAIYNKVRGNKVDDAKVEVIEENPEENNKNQKEVKNRK